MMYMTVQVVPWQERPTAGLSKRFATPEAKKDFASRV
jgi:hypothetical protein